jgi:predicted lipoprotein with Yx(FWY)xxD motif
VLAVGASAVLLAACGGNSSGGGGSSGSSGAASKYGGGTTAASAKPAAKVALTTEHSNLGTMLTDGAKRTVYLFEKDAHGRSACAGACTGIWPPLTVGGGAKPVAGKGVSAQLLGTTARPGGGRQVTYAGHPLYYYAADQHPGQTGGQGLDQFGAEWYVLAPKGTAIDTGS